MIREENLWAENVFHDHKKYGSLLLPRKRRRLVDEELTTLNGWIPVLLPGK
jgi:hypothetical protein